MSAGTASARHRAWTLRQAVSADAPAYAAYMNEVGGESDYLSFGRNEYGRSVEEVAAMIQAISSRDNELFLLAFVDDRLVGALMLEAAHRPRLRHAAELSITVRKEFWGSGVSSALMDACLEWLHRTKTLAKVNLRVREDHARAIRLYEKKGFVSEGVTARAMLVNGRFYTVRHMGLVLDV